MDFYINNKIIQLDKKTLPIDEPLVSYNKGYEANFIFDEEWDGLVKTVRFINGDRYKDVILIDDKCEFPIDIMGSVVAVGVFAGDLKSTNASYVLFLPSILEKFGIPVDPTPEVYLQVIRMIQEIQNKAVTDEQIEEALDDYFEENPIDTEDINLEALSNTDIEDILRSL